MKFDISFTNKEITPWSELAFLLYLMDKGIVWASPFRVEITDELQEGENKLEIKVVNSWYNRVAGDQMFPDKKQYTSTNINLNHNYRGREISEIPLESSGLLGPVLIEVASDELTFR